MQGAFDTYNEDHVGLTADADPSILLHFSEDDILNAPSRVLKLLGTKTPKDRIPNEGNGSLMFVFIGIEQHLVQRDH